MARLGFAIAGAVVGSFFGPLGTQIGFAVGGLVGSMLFPAKLPSGPRLNDLIISTATDGAPIPFGYNQQRIAGNIIWAPPIVETTQTTSAKGGPKQTNYVYTANFAVAFCEGPASIGRIWFDSKVVYDSRATLQNPGHTPPIYAFSAPITGSSAIGNQIQVASTLQPPAGTEVTISGAPQGNGTFQVIATAPTQFSYYNPNGVAPGSSGTAAMPPIKYPAPVIYPGTEAQTADPTIQGAVGAANCSAFRGLCYAVWTNFPLNDFGNRIPNVRAEVNFSTPLPVGVRLVQEAGNTQDQNISPNISVGMTNTQGNFLFAVHLQDTSSSTSTIGDILGNTWVKITSLVNPGNQWTNLWYCASCKGGTNSITAHIGSGISNGAALQVFEFSGVNASNPLGPTGFGGVSSVNGNNTTPSITTNAPSQFVIAGYSAEGAAIPYTAGTGWTAGGFNQGVVNHTIGITGTQFLEFQTVPNSGTAISGSATSSAGANVGIYTIALNSASTAFTTSPTLANIVSDICLRSGLLATDIDVTQLALLPGSSPAVPVPAPGGYTISRPTTAQNALKPLAEAFFFDAVESGGVIRFVPRGNLPITAVTIPETDLGLVKDNFKLAEQLQMAQELPREVAVLFQDKNLDYQQNKTHKRRATRIVKTKNQTVYELAMVLDPNTARQIAEKAVYIAYLERHPYDFNLWRPLYMLFDPTDVIQFTYEGLNFVARIVRSDIGVDFSSALSLVSEDTATYQSTIQGSSGTGVTPAQAKVLPDTTLFLFDVPLMQDTDSNPGGTGKYFAMSSLDPTHWPGGSLQKSSDNVNFAQENTSVKAAHYGAATTVLPPPPTRGALGGVSPWVWDTVSTLTVFMQNGVLTGTADISVLNGQNALLVGSPTNGWELIQYGNSVQNADGSFTISRFLRGRRGTESQCALHGPGEFVIDVIAAGVVRQPNATSDLQVLRYYNAVTSGNTLNPAQSQTLNLRGLDVFPYAVTSVAGARDQSGNLTVSWIRRTRIGGDWLAGIGTVQLGETTESYDIDILTGPNGTVVRTFSAQPTPALAYSAAQQTTDFGGPQVAISMNIYQNSSIIGRGFVKSVTL